MSNPDSFIDEVTEEVRRDRLFALLRRYGWIAALMVVVVVGGAAFNEWRKAREVAAAQELGDALLAAMEAETPDARAAMLSEVQAEGAAVAIRNLLAAGELAGSDAAGAQEAAGAELQAVADAAEVAPVYRDLAVLRLVMLPDYPMLSEERLARLEPLLAPGAPFRLIAMEISGLLHAERGEAEAALEQFRQISADSAASAAQRARVQELIVALGGLPDNS